MGKILASSGKPFWFSCIKVAIAVLGLCLVRAADITLVGFVIGMTHLIFAVGIVTYAAIQHIADWARWTKFVGIINFRPRPKALI